MDLIEVLHLFWRRRLLIVLTTALAIGIAIAFLRLVTPLYESSATMALKTNQVDAITLFATVDAIVPIYADGATSRSTRDLAASNTGERPSSISVETFRGTPLFKIIAKDSNRHRARRSVQSVVAALQQRIANDQIGIPTITLDEIDHPTLATSPSFPRRKLTIGIAVLLGLGFGAAAALLRERLTSRIETPEAVADAAGAPCFAEIPRDRSVTRVRYPEEFTANTKLRVVNEAFRDLRTNLMFAEETLSSIVVTSPEGSHGKTTVAVGLATAFARAGTDTLLVDADLRRGRIAAMLGLPHSPGLTESLHGAHVEPVHTSLSGLDVLPTGSINVEPGEELLSRFARILSDLENRYEMVVVDTTPLIPVNDARIFASFADAALIVVSADGATRRQVREAVHRLELVSVEPIAVVLNNSKDAKRSYYTSAYLTQERAPERM
jgi:succinoglycan biosynthesis transport protein ExoP